MTGNVVFIGFGLAGAPGFSVGGSLVALFGFALGAAVGGVLSRRDMGRDRLLISALIIEFVLTSGAVIVLLARLGVVGSVTAVGLEGIALGVQNAVVRALAVPDLTTTVLTMSITGIAANLRRAERAAALRRATSVIAMLVGAVIGAVAVLHLPVPAALGLECAILLSALTWVAIAAARGSAWTARDI